MTKHCKHGKNSPVTFVTYKRFAVPFFLTSFCVNRLTNFVLTIISDGDQLATRKGIRIPESSKFLPVEYGILGFGIRNTAQGI